MSKVILIKHASPEVNPAIPAGEWRLSEKGRLSCDGLASRLRPFSPTHIITSAEPKAVETGQIIAVKLNVPITQAPDLHEHDRSNVPHMRASEFISAVSNFFKKPDELVLGRETADAAADRFEKAVDKILEAHASATPAIVSHGTVLSLLMRRKAKMNPFELWRRMQLPAFVVVELPGWKVLEVVERV